MRLGEHAVAREAATFVAREAELSALAALLAPGSAHRVALVTGAAGVGKTALLREAVRRGSALGYTPVWFDARESAGGGRTSADAVADAAGTEQPLLVVDSAEELGPDEGALRDRLLGSLPAAARVVLVSRRPLDPAWWSSTWAPSLVSVPVGPLASGGAAAFLAARGLADPDEVAAVVAWAEGHALSLTLAAAVRGSTGRPLGGLDLAALETDLLDHLTGRRLVGADLVGTDRLVLAVAAVAPAVDAALLDAVLPGVDGEAAERWLRALPFAERLGHRVTLHQRVRRLLAAQLRQAEPDVERDLRLRVIDHLTSTDHARDDRAALLIGVREVLAPPQDHGVTPSRALASSWHCRPATPDDAPAVRALLAGADPAYVAWAVGRVERDPEHVLVVACPEDGARLTALTVWATGAAGAAGDVERTGRPDPVLDRWTALARDWSGATLLQPLLHLDVAPGDHAEVCALLLSSLVQRCGLTDFRRWVVTHRPPGPDPAHCGGVRDRRFDVRLGSLLLPGHVIDYGPDGAIAAMREEAYGVLAPTPQAPAAGPDVEHVREALRRCHDPVWLAGCDLAVGADPAARAASVLALLREGVAQAFGEGPDARLQREVIERGYLDPEANHARAMRTLHLSRTTYFRRLREATATLAAWLAVRAGAS